ncbi:D-aminoacyl-tRNA deacylase [Polaribacter sp.]|uniref:D-aminoacyl-tRNA deacylase n=1 Tax=Polaribacter sp. TaxID=1920175 RepID=UPI003F6A3BFA
MRVVVQRVSKASVTIKQKKVAKIKEGLLILLGITATDTKEDIEYLVKKIANLRVFNDENQVMNVSLKDLNAEVIVVSQFTLFAFTKKGNRPSYIRAAKPDVAIPLYHKFVTSLEDQINTQVQTGVFGADMKVALRNDGPVTIIIDSKTKDF